MFDQSDLIKGFLEGRSTVLKKIYDNSFHYVKRYIVTHNGSKKDAEDIFHNALVILFVKLKKEQIVIQSFDKYLFTICKNMWRRENAKNRVTNNENITLVSEETELASFYIEESQWELYQEKFKELSAQCKEILKMVFEKKTYDEIVKKYNYTTKTVARQRVFKCKKRLIEIIKKDKRYIRLKK